MPVNVRSPDKTIEETELEIPGAGFSPKKEATQSSMFTNQYTGILHESKQT